MLLRVYLILRLIPNATYWTSMNAENWCEKEGIEANLQFALKSLLKEKPYKILLINFALSVGIFGISVRSFER